MINDEFENQKSKIKNQKSKIINQKYHELFFLKIFTRNLSRQGMFPLINIAGLAVGLAVVLLICAYVFNEYSYDKSFTHHQRIYRANTHLAFPGMEGVSGVSSNALAPAAKEEIPGVEIAVRTYGQQVDMKVDNVPYKVNKLAWVDLDIQRPSMVQHIVRNIFSVGSGYRYCGCGSRNAAVG